MLFKVSSSTNTIVANLWEGRGSKGHWMVQFRRPFEDRELEEVTQYLDLVYPMTVQGEDTSLWREDRRGSFNVKLYYSLCDETNIAFPVQDIWGVPIPPKNVLFCMECCIEKDLNSRYFNDGQWSTNTVVFVKKMKNQLIISWFIMKK